jgi:hypothetical protein
MQPAARRRRHSSKPWSTPSPVKSTPRPTDNGVQFFHQPSKRNGPTARYGSHMFNLRCRQNGIEHRLAKPNHPCSLEDQQGRHRTRYHHENRAQLEAHLADFLDAYNFAKRLQPLNGLTPHEYVCAVWTNEPDRFTFNPTHLTSRLNI